jgi:soluble lytic murein transglycosylase-like protein
MNQKKVSNALLLKTMIVTIVICTWCLTDIAADPVDTAETTVRQALKAIQHETEGDHASARDVWKQLADDSSSPIQRHALHLAAQNGIRQLEKDESLTEDMIAMLKIAVFQELKSLADNRSFTKHAQAREELLGFLVDTQQWTKLLEEIPAGSRNTTHQYMRATAYYHLNRPEQSESTIKPLWQNPDNARLANDIDALYQQVRHRLDKSYPGVSVQQLYQRARALDRIGRRHEAAETYQQVIDGNASRDWKANATLFRAKILYDTFQNDECMALYQSFLRDFPGHASTATVLMRKSIVYRRMQNNQKYLEMVDRVERHHSGSIRLNGMLVGRGDYWRSQQEWDKAEADYLKVMRSGGDERDQAWWKWVWTAFNRGDPGQAAERMTQMIAQYAGSGWDRPMRYWRARFNELADVQTERDQAEYRRIATDFGWEYYGVVSGKRLDVNLPEPTRNDAPKIYPDENNLQAVKAAKILETLELWDRASAEWDVAVRKTHQPSAGLVLNRMNGLVNAGRVPVARRHILQQYGTRVNNGNIPESAAQILYPFPAHLRQYYESNARRKGLDPLLAASVTLQESGFDQNALSHNLAGGLMQIMPQLFERLSAEWPYQPESEQYMLPKYNIRAGVEYLAWLLARYDGSIPKALAAYNAGEHRVDNWIVEYQYPDEIWIEHIPFRQTRLFVKKVLENYACYSAIYNHVNDTGGGGDQAV